MGGDTASATGYSSYPDAGSYGTQGVTSTGNKPRSRKFGTTWRDASNNLWMYGGAGDDATSSAIYNYLNDRWRYTPSDDQWTWMHGDSVYNKPPVYGTQGIPAAANTPGLQGSTRG